ncbi:hypothetical protein SAMN06295998_10716 [Primorskyibacter flagellatus]|uniref:Uncharacterized protein n=1 Tax=Primorskyibacter flagellatus TaxID=1387277 RepID=A0A1W2CAS3_9RHOB|nr:hypothetical protein SAMN06295998_10716 [Primorskyibacter flagellatus]
MGWSFYVRLLPLVTHQRLGNAMQNIYRSLDWI